MKFIFEVRMKPGYTVEEYADAWMRASAIIQQAPGARGTFLHRKIGEPDTLLAIATWESKAHRDAKDDRRSETVRKILEKHAQKCEISVIGEFDDPAWTVMPPAHGAGADPGNNDCTGSVFAPSETAMNSNTTPGANDHDRIDVAQEADLRKWAQKLDTTPQQLKDAVAAVGPLADDVELHLKGVRSTTNNDETKRAGS